MDNRDHLGNILDRILNGSQTEEDIAQLERSLNMADGILQLVSQDGKFNTNIGQITGGDIHLGDRIYQGADAEAIKEILREALKTLQPNTKLTGIPENLPRSGVVQFVGREQELETLHQQLQENTRVAVCAIAGMGGSCLLSLFALAPIPWSLVEPCLPEQDQEDLEELRDDNLLNLNLIQRKGVAIYQLHQLIREFFQAKQHSIQM